jgi:RNA polymerase sigma factor (sigma-70 family)
MNEAGRRLGPNFAMSPRISIRLLAAQSDQRLVALVHEGHERAFEALVHRYRRPLLNYCRSAMKMSDVRAEDVLQHALLQAWLALARGCEVRDLKPWLYRIVHNSAVNAMRGSSDSHAELTEAIHAHAAVASESDLDRRIAVREALTDVASLPQMQRQAMFLTAVDGQSHDEVATALGISNGAVRGLLYRARATLRSAAAAITPQPLIEWASGGAGSSAPTAERLAELSAGGGAVGVTGLLLKGTVVAVTAAALATGATAVHSHHGARSPSGRVSPIHSGASAGGAGSVGALADSMGASAQVPAGVRYGASGSAQRRARSVAPAPRRLSAAMPGQLLPGDGGRGGLLPAERHGDGQGGAAGDPEPGAGTSAGPPDGGGEGSSSGSGSHGGRDSSGEGAHNPVSSGTDSSGGGSGGGGSGGDGTHAAAAAPDEPAGEGGTSSPDNKQGQPGQSLTTADGSSGDHTSAAEAPATSGS